MVKSGTSAFRSVPRNAHAADRSPASQTGRADLAAPAIDRPADAGGAYMGLWEIFNWLGRKLRSELRKYPPDQSRLDWILKLQQRILLTLLPYERPKLKSIAPPAPVLQPDLSRLTKKERHDLARLLPKMGVKAGEIEGPKPTNRRSASRPVREHAANRSPTGQTGRAGLGAPAIDYPADAGHAYLRLWEIINELKRKPQRIRVLLQALCPRAPLLRF
jgi:hypothetical protein